MIPALQSIVYFSEFNRVIILIMITDKGPVTELASTMPREIQKYKLFFITAISCISLVAITCFSTFFDRTIAMFTIR